MIAEGQMISFRNVVSKFYTLYPNDMNLVIEEMGKELEMRNLTPSGPMFYSTITDFREEPLTMEVFVPVEENQLPDMQDKEIIFRSYFLIESMIMTRVSNDYETQTIEKHIELIRYTEEHNMEIGSHFFVMPRVVEDHIYIEIYLKALFEN
ncbi:DUF5085 family protein [Vagococcus entomophilus]|uniref:DUF5085 domain-containing protein n=1 Tax=Vagococcus entomophilus TaxID=1160095 RepID=A0A430AKF4_9ENTE|nr:DUF5085 family protein [Vagococcus entomophilus]RSU08558.1 hypothetical protein CBF30_04825 [Vagococcus entomophilus]